MFGASFEEGDTAEEIGEIAKAAVKAFIASLNLKKFADFGATKEGVVGKAEEIMNDPQWYPTPNKLPKEELEAYLAELYDTFA